MTVTVCPFITQATLAQITETVAPIVDKAATASDRWLFIAALAIIIGGGSLAIRWLIKSIEVQNAAHAAERKELGTALASKDAVHVAERERLIAEIKAEHAECRVARKEDQAAFLAALEKKDAALTANTKAMESLITHMERRNP